MHMHGDIVCKIFTIYVFIIPDLHILNVFGHGIIVKRHAISCDRHCKHWYVYIDIDIDVISSE